METFSLVAIVSRQIATNLQTAVQAASSQKTIVLPEINTTRPNESVDSPTKPSLSVSLKKGTAKSHRAAENVHFVRNFIRGKIDRDLYKHLVSSLYGIYSVLEEELNKHAPRHFPNLHHPAELSRKESLERDMIFFFGETNLNLIKLNPTKATIEYQQRIREIAEKTPLLLLAHAYTRYLGDLSGGRVLQRVARKAMNLSSSDGLAFYDFDNVPDPKIFKNDYRKALDDLELTEREVTILVGEANVAFVMNMRIFEELDVLAGVEGAEVRPLDKALLFADFDPTDNNNSGSNKCPFAAMKTVPTGKSSDLKYTNITGGCPWPFLLMHDPKKGFRRMQTGVLFGLVLAFIAAAATHTQQYIQYLFGTIALWYFFISKGDLKDKNKVCPWPFVFFHDPKAGILCYQTWIVIVVLSSWVFNRRVFQFDNSLHGWKEGITFTHNATFVANALLQYD